MSWRKWLSLPILMLGCVLSIFLSMISELAYKADWILVHIMHGIVGWAEKGKP